jgi:hypothetical protein
MEHQLGTGGVHESITQRQAGGLEEIYHAISIRVRYRPMEQTPENIKAEQASKYISPKRKYVTALDMRWM